MKTVTLLVEFHCICRKKTGGGEASFLGEEEKYLQGLSLYLERPGTLVKVTGHIQGPDTEAKSERQGMLSFPITWLTSPE